jgi:hypothetical protein
MGSQVFSIFNSDELLNPDSSKELLQTKMKTEKI